MTELIDALAEVWAATWVPGPSPVEGFGDASGYAVAWVQVPGGERLHVLVDGTGAPRCGAIGRVRTAQVRTAQVRTAQVANEEVLVFVPEEEGSA
jgi:hypothetical protein